jgi:lysophospholipase L1-like esterase
MARISRRRFFGNAAANFSASAGLLAGASAIANQAETETDPDPAPATKDLVPDSDGLVWRDVSDWGIEGRGWSASNTARFYDRLPAKAERVVRPPVWSLSHHSAGMMTRFDTDATDIHVRYKVTNASLAMPHMPATGVSGIDLYALDETGKPRWIAVNRPSGGPDIKSALATGIDPGLRRFSAYLPLYNGVEKLEIGVPAAAEFTGVAPRTEKPLVFWGTSITHGACASRPGMPHPAILGRRLDLPVINLGFSGNGKMEIEVAALISEIDAAVFVIDCLPNISAPIVAERTEPLVRKLRDVRPDTPIVLVEDRTYGNAWIRKSSRERHRDSRAALLRAHDNLIESGIRNLHYLRGAELLGDDDEATTDGSHPNDLGFMRQADAFEPVLREALGMPAAEE